MAAKSDGDTILLNCLEAFKRIPPQVRSLPGLVGPLSASISSAPSSSSLQDPFLSLTLQPWPPSSQPSRCVVHDSDFCIQKMPLSVLSTNTVCLCKCLCSDETEIRVGPCSILTAKHACGINRASSICEHSARATLELSLLVQLSSIVVSLALICYSCNGN